MEKDKIIGSMMQGNEAQKEKARIYSIIEEDLNRRDQETKFFRGSNLQTYSDASLAQFVGHREKPEWKKDYQYNVFDPITRDKVMAIISKSAGLYEAEFFNTNKKLAKISETISTVLSAFYRDSTIALNEKETNKEIMLQALISPKAILYEGWKYQKRTIRDIEERDDNGKIVKTKPKKIVHYNGPYSELVQIEDFIPGSLRTRNLQEQPRLTWIPRMQMETFRRMFPVSKYPEAAKVRPHGQLFDNNISEFTLRNDLKENEVEVPMLFEKWDDRLSISANGILLTRPNSPMPFAHKDYPFVWGGFEPLSPFFVYDMPLTMKIMDMQDVTNEVLNLTLDMVWRALHEVVLVKDGDEINDDVLYGGGMVSVDDPKNFQKFEFGSSSAFNSATNLIDRARRSIESASLDAPLSGQSGSRAITAREAMIAREAALEITTLFLQNMESMEREKARLRVKNQLDRYKKPMDWQKRIGEDLTESAMPVFKELSVRNTKLDGGKRGTANITVTETPRPKSELNKLNVQNDKEMSQTIDISPELIREIDFDVQIVANSSIKKSRAQTITEARGFLSDASAMPDVLNKKYAAKEYVKAMGKKEDEALVNDAEQMNPMAKPGGVKPAITESPDSIETILNNQSL